MTDRILTDLGDLPSEEEFRSMRQYIPEEPVPEISSLTRQAIEEAKKPSNTAIKALETAESFIGTQVVHSLTEGHKEINPLIGEGPYRMNNVSFVYWCFHRAGFKLPGGNTGHTIHTIKKDPRLEKVGNIGSNIGVEMLSKGDIVFFNNDKHIGIYAGDGEFISLLGGGENNHSSGVRKLSLEQGKWYKYFQGHVLRHKGVR